MSRKQRWFLDAAILSAWLLADNPEATGIPIHEWLSIGLALAAAVHLALNWEWVLHAARRMLRRLRTTTRINLVVDVVLFVAFVTVMQSGIAVSEAILPLVGLSAVSGHFWSSVHSVSAEIGIIALAVHFALHRRWIAGTARQLLPSARPYSPANVVVAERASETERDAP